MSILKEIAINYHTRYGFNVLPLIGKAPIIPWDKWQSEFQTADDVKRMNWRSASGIGVVQGINDLCVIDIDGLIDFDVLPRLLESLGLKEDYRWITESGSGKGLHITFTLGEPANLAGRFGDKGVLVFKLKEKDICDHIELRIKNCQTAFPPSVHPDTRTCYSFYDPGHEPNEKPVTVASEKVIQMINKFCIITTPHTVVKAEKETGRMTAFDRNNLQSALDFLSKNLTKGTYYAWFRIGMALVTLGEKGEEMFVRMSVKNPHFRDNEDDVRARFRQFAASSRGSITLSSVYFIAEQYGWKKPIIRFWEVVKGKVRLNEVAIRNLFESEGFCKIIIDKEYIFAKVNNYVVEETTIPMIKDFAKEYIEGISDKELGGITHDQLLSIMIKRSGSFFTPQFLEFLRTNRVDFVRDTADKGVIFYRNGALLVTKEGAELHNYNSFGKYIWKTQLLDRDFKFSERKSDFETFLRRVVENQEDRFNALKSAVGYLLHRYKDPANALAIIFMDEQNSDGAYGRCGKGLVIQAISKLRKTVFLDGRNFSPSKNFAFQRVELDTDIIALEDLSKKFPFSRLFSVITEGMTIERKNKNELFLPFSLAPKSVASTNFTVPGIDDSTIARQFIIEFSNHYNLKHKPLDEFTKKFFYDWDTAEWEAFDNFMVDCLAYYLKNGLVSYKFRNLGTKQMIDETAPEFIEFIESETGVTLFEEYDKKELHNRFIGEYTDFANLKQQTFTRWLKAYAKLKGLEYTERRSKTERYFSLKDKVKVKVEVEVKVEEEVEEEVI